MSSPFENPECELPCESQSEIEVAGAIDAFVSLEEIFPDAEWADVLADSWGVPASDEKPQASRFRSLLKKVNVPGFR